MPEGIVVDGPPVPSYEGGDKKDERTLRLMEIGHEHVHDTEAETRHNDDPGVEFELVEAVVVEVSDYRIKGFLQ